MTIRTQMFMLDHCSPAGRASEIRSACIRAGRWGVWLLPRRMQDWFQPPWPLLGVGADGIMTRGAADADDLLTHGADLRVTLLIVARCKHRSRKVTGLRGQPGVSAEQSNEGQFSFGGHSDNPISRCLVQLTARVAGRPPIAGGSWAGYLIRLAEANVQHRVDSRWPWSSTAVVRPVSPPRSAAVLHRDLTVPANTGRSSASAIELFRRTILEQVTSLPDADRLVTPGRRSAAKYIEHSQCLYGGSR